MRRQPRGIPALQRSSFYTKIDVSILYLLAVCVYRDSALAATVYILVRIS